MPAPLMTRCTNCGTPVRVKATRLNSSSDEIDLDGTLCVRCLQKQVLAERLGRDPNEKTPPKVRVDRRYGNVACRFDDPALVARYFAELDASGGIFSEACAFAGVSATEVVAKRRVDAEFATREREIRHSAKVSACRLLNHRLIEVAYGGLMVAKYDPDSYDMELPEGIDPDEYTIDELARLSKPAPKLKGFVALEPNVNAITRYLATHDPDWRDAANDRNAEDRAISAICDRLGPMLRERLGDVPKSMLLKHVKQIVREENEKQTQRIN